MNNLDTKENDVKKENKKLTVNEMLYAKYGGKDVLSHKAIDQINRRFIKLFTKNPSFLERIIRILRYPRGKKLTKEEITKIIFLGGYTNSIEKAKSVVDEVVTTQFRISRLILPNSIRFEFEMKTDKDGGIRYIMAGNTNEFEL